MVSEFYNNSILLSRIHEGREGIQLERTFSALSFLLHGWCTFRGKRKPLYEREEKGKKKENEKIRKEDIEPLPVIHFEKLALFASRIWNEMFSIEAVKKIIDSSNKIKDANIITFPFPFQEFPAKHGRRLQRLNGKEEYVYIVEILHKLQRADIHYFEIRTHRDAADNPNDYRTTVMNAFPITNSEDFLEKFTSFEIQILKDLDNSLKRLGASEIRALGTHENKEKTIYDIEKEFRDMYRYIPKVINSLDRDDCFFYSSYEMMTYADEAWRKSTYNRMDYIDAYNRMLTEINNPILKAAFQSCQKSHEQIWGTDQVIDGFAQTSKKTKAFTKYLHAIAYYRGHISERVLRRSKDAKRIGHIFDESLQEMNQCGFNGFPSEIHDLFIGNTSEIKQEVRNQLIGELESLRAWIEENIEHA